MSKYLPRILLVLVLMCFGIPPLLADGVYTCKNVAAEGAPYFGCSNADQVIKADVLPGDLVPVAPSSAKIGIPDSFWYATPVLIWRKWSSTTDASLIGICGGDKRTLSECAAGNGGKSQVQVRSAIAGLTVAAPAEPFVYKAPSCWFDGPGYVWGKRVGAKIYGLWYCDKPTGIALVSRGIDLSVDPAKAVDVLFGSSDAELGALDAKYINRTATDAEIEIFRALHTSTGVKGTPFNGNYATAPTYYRNADGTRGEESRTRVPTRDDGDVKAGDCALEHRLITIKDGKAIGTDYYAVVGSPWDAQRQSYLYARCKIVGNISK